MQCSGLITIRDSTQARMRTGAVGACLSAGVSADPIAPGRGNRVALTLGDMAGEEPNKPLKLDIDPAASRAAAGPPQSQRVQRMSASWQLRYVSPQGRDNGR